MALEHTNTSDIAKSGFDPETGAKIVSIEDYRNTATAQNEDAQQAVPSHEAISKAHEAARQKRADEAAQIRQSWAIEPAASTAQAEAAEPIAQATMTEAIAWPAVEASEALAEKPLSALEVARQSAELAKSFKSNPENFQDNFIRAVDLLKKLPDGHGVREATLSGMYAEFLKDGREVKADNAEAYLNSMGELSQMLPANSEWQQKLEDASAPVLAKIWSAQSEAQYGPVSEPVKVESNPVPAAENKDALKEPAVEAAAEEAEEVAVPAPAAPVAAPVAVAINPVAPEAPVSEPELEDDEEKEAKLEQYEALLVETNRKVGDVQRDWNATPVSARNSNINLRVLGNLNGNVRDYVNKTIERMQAGRFESIAGKVVGELQGDEVEDRINRQKQINIELDKLQEEMKRATFESAEFQNAQKQLEKIEKKKSEKLLKKEQEANQIRGRFETKTQEIIDRDPWLKNMLVRASQASPRMRSNPNWSKTLA